MFGLSKKTTMIPEAEALPGRTTAIATAERHFLSDRPLKSAIPEGMEEAIFGMGCFWGVERMFWSQPGVWLTMVGYAAGHTPNPTYQEVCSGQTGHNEVVRVIYDPSVTSYDALLKVFWEGHDPTQGMQQGNDRGTQYRSGIYTFSDAQAAAATSSLGAMTPRLQAAGLPAPTTEILPAPTFYYAEDYHQQYLAKNPDGYCGLGGTGVTCPIGTGVTA
ncbi:peptide-methionine (S)-S-oxide reductase MsrA [Pseudoruegeria sp. SK021]|uniref:peptide-methionine (S)-S-oxide reductase MsrA n=1 Tax=Pseudoruegeria sp. SK021 TaxID=1933035 RepID=UPI000A244FFA|nr:peptide-methionine (S)-S-oxide reductase MsrA [Pseudoruegeria sp. SK021]OSP55195.1 peptide-methionine (S)-S-oxide reductase [Pseudoruegeria sp. SK021]